ncbi:MAG: ATP-dependent helicase [Breznakia sp.]
MDLDLLKGLNKQQRLAVEACDAHVRIVAGAGSGKTRVITTRIAYLMETLQVEPYRILAITFTNKAANEMKYRVSSILGVAQSGVTISTIHALCVRILREDIHFFKYPRSFVILDSDDQKSILRDIYRQLKIDVKTLSFAQALSYISSNKTAFIDPETAFSHATYDFEKLKVSVYEQYVIKLKGMQALDFDDLLLFVYVLFRDYVDIREKWASRYDYLHVDEFQDVDEIQYGIVRYLVKKDAYLCVVGDPDQTIYTWRGAKVDIIMNFEKDFPNSKTIILNENYRSTKNILAGANTLIKNNEFRVDKDLFTNNKDNSKIHYYASVEEVYEAQWIARKIVNIHNTGVAYPDMAILYRSNYLSRNLEKVLLDASIPYRIYGGIKFFERAEIKDALSYLRLLVDNNEGMSELAIKRILNVPRRGIGPKALEALATLADVHQKDYFKTLQQFPITKGKAQTKVDEFVGLIQKWRVEKEQFSISIVLRKLLEESQYLWALEQANEEERLENLQELIHDIENYEEHSLEASLDDYLQMISLYTDHESEDKQDCIQLMSVHAAKGLEFHSVFVYSLCEGIFPNERSIQEGGKQALEEERRLAYVAFTRAKKRLYLSSSGGYSYVTQKLKSTSRFVNELGEDVIEKEGEIFNPYASKMKSVPITSDSHNTVAASIMPKSKTKGRIRKGDLIQHPAFGDGVVLVVHDGVAKIAFDKKFGVKRLAANHHSITKK